jgi:GNAT superfamily N-acetyltransferase
VTQRPYQRSYAADAGLSDAVFGLLDTWAPSIRALADRARRLNWAWERVSTPFVYVEGGALLSHVGVLEMPLFLTGAAQRVGGIHAVCTHPEHRRRGLFRRVMEDALRYCDERYETVELTTDHPEYYDPSTTSRSAFASSRSTASSRSWARAAVDPACARSTSASRATSGSSIDCSRSGSRSRAWWAS